MRGISAHEDMKSLAQKCERQQMFRLPDGREQIGGKRGGGACSRPGGAFRPSVCQSVGLSVGQPSAGVVCERVSERAGEWLV